MGDTWAVPDDQVMIPHIIRNKDEIFCGGILAPYLKAMFTATNVNNPYHDLRHGLHVARSGYLAARYHYKDLTPREIRNVVIAAMMHDMNHSGKAKFGTDFLEIPRAIHAFEQCVMEEDRPHMDAIRTLIKVTQFPLVEMEESLSIRIIRDADMTQSFGVAWLRQIAVGLAEEWGMEPLQILKGQKAFLSGIMWKTEWGQKTFPPEVVQMRIDEAEDYVALLS